MGRIRLAGKRSRVARTPELDRAIPASLDGYPVEVRVTGAFGLRG